MKCSRLGVAVFAAGLAVALGAFGYLLDHARASARVIPGLGEAAEPEREEAREVPDLVDDAGGDEVESARLARPATPREPSGLVVRVVDEHGEPIDFVDVLAYRGDELVRADHAMTGTATLIPFDGPGRLRVEHDTLEIARLEIPEGRGRYEITVPHTASVAGVVRVDGVAREGIRLGLTRGSDGWLDAWVAYGLETVGLRTRTSQHIESTARDGTFRFEWLGPDWTGVLQLVDLGDHRFADGARRIELARPDEGLVLELAAKRPELEFHGRVVFAGEPVPGAMWELSSSGWGHCDELGRFSVHAFADELEGLKLDLSQADLGRRTVEFGGPEIRSDLGDIELLPKREVAFVVRSDAGTPIAGARARPRLRPETTDRERFMGLNRASKPTDSAGRGVSSSLRQDESAILVSAPGYEQADALVPADLSEPISIVLPRCATVQVALRDRSGRAPRGLRVRLEARGPPFTWANGYEPEGDELTIENYFGGWGRRTGDGYSGEFLPSAHGRVWIDSLRAGVPFDLSAVDALGSVVAFAPEIVLGTGEWRRVDLRVQAEPRTLLVVVRDALGFPLPSANLKVWISPETEPDWSGMNTDRAGMVRTEPFYSDHVTLRVSRWGFESRTLEHVAVPPEGATVQLRLAHDWWP